jgi:hypothetical protein
MTNKAPVFHRAHFNILASEIREQLEHATNFYAPKWEHGWAGDKRNYYAVEALVKLALSLAKRFQDEREGYDGFKFDPLRFLDACSPDPELYPLSELWEDYVNA